MHGLKTLDHVAYIRFASIYKDFSEASDFAEIAGEVVEAPPEKGTTRPPAETSKLL
jgi:transcriptional repressor NrdR